MVIEAATNDYDFRIRGAIRGRADTLIIDADRVEFASNQVRPTVEEIRRAFDPLLHEYRQGQANVGNRIQGGETTPMSGWKIALVLFVAGLVAAVAGAIIYPTETRNLSGSVWARVVTATCISPAPYATFDGIHESGDSKWRVPVDTCPD